MASWKKVVVSGSSPEFANITGSGDMKLAGDLIVSGGDITLGSTSIFSGGDTTSLNNIDALDATTEATVEAAIDTLSNLTTTGTLNSGAISSGFGAIDIGTSTLNAGNTTVDTLVNDSSVANSRITGSFTQTGNLITSDTFIHNGHATIGGIITAEKIVSELTQSATFFDSGSTLFGDSIDDTHILSGSSSISGSSINFNYFSLEEISNDTTLADESSTAVVTENVVKTYLDEAKTEGSDLDDEDEALVVE